MNTRKSHSNRFVSVRISLRDWAFHVVLPFSLGSSSVVFLLCPYDCSVRQNIVAWRKAFGAESIFEEDPKFDQNMNSVAFMNYYDKVDHLVCYKSYGIFLDTEFHERIFLVDFCGFEDDIDIIFLDLYCEV